jgi:hypothetical protein
MPESDGQNMIADLLADNHHTGGTGPLEARELRLVQVALSSLNTLNNAIKGNLAGRSPLAGGLLHSFSETAEATARRFCINRQPSSGRERTLCQHPSLTGDATQACMDRRRPFSRFCLLGMLLAV